MHPSFVLAVLGFLASTVAGAAIQVRNTPLKGNSTRHQTTGFRHFECGTNITHASEELLNSSKILHESHKLFGLEAPQNSRKSLRARDVISIPTYFHIITTAADPDAITDDMANGQLAALNKAYNPQNIHFHLAASTRHSNDVWAVGDGAAEGDINAKLRSGTYSALNMYFQSDLGGSILGKCSMPSAIGDAPVDRSVYVSDGCHISGGTMPGGVVDGYNMGMTAVHEVGHWLGLLHTFEGYSCDGDGDLIVDTPVQSTSTDGCPTNPPKNSCPRSNTAPGPDMIHNYMDYSIDSCYESFTPGQGIRMHDNWAQFRGGR